MAESVLRERHRTRSIFVNPIGGAGLGVPTHQRHRSSLASELGRDHSFSYIQNQIKNANVPIGTLFENDDEQQQVTPRASLQHNRGFFYGADGVTSDQRSCIEMN